MLLGTTFVVNGISYLRDVASHRADCEGPQVVTGPLTGVIGVCLSLKSISNVGL